jgi:hypothetical protein
LQQILVIYILCFNQFLTTTDVKIRHPSIYYSTNFADDKVT